MPVKVYISSTFADLIEYRLSVYEALRKMRIDTIVMEDYVAQDTRPLEKCLEDVASSDIYVGIFGWRYAIHYHQIHFLVNDFLFLQLLLRLSKNS